MKICVVFELKNQIKKKKMNNLQANLNNLLPKGASSKLKDLIRTVRACKVMIIYYFTIFLSISIRIIIFMIRIDSSLGKKKNSTFFLRKMFLIFFFDIN